VLRMHMSVQINTRWENAPVVMRPPKVHSSPSSCDSLLFPSLSPTSSPRPHLAQVVIEPLC
jgi:hypothetical protein